MDIDIGFLTLNEYYRRTLSEQSSADIPWQVKLLENPDSLLPFPGQIYLKEHDFLHIIFDLDLSSMSEAFLVGFCMGLDPTTKPYHLAILKFVSKWFYPKKYQFNDIDIAFLYVGYEVALKRQYQEIDRMNFSSYLDLKVSDLRKRFPLPFSELRAIRSLPEKPRTFSQEIGGFMPAYSRSP